MQEMHYRLDVRRAIDAIALLKVTQALKRLRPGETLEILLGDDIQTRKDLFQIVDASAYQLVSKQHRVSSYRILLRKRED